MELSAGIFSGSFGKFAGQPDRLSGMISCRAAITDIQTAVVASGRCAKSEIIELTDVERFAGSTHFERVDIQR